MTDPPNTITEEFIDQSSKAPWVIVLQNGTYTFTNVEHHTSLSIYNNSASGPITGLVTQTAQNWLLKNIENNIITLQNDLLVPTWLRQHIPSRYVYIVGRGEIVIERKVIQRDIPLVGSLIQYQWVVKPYPGTDSKYYFVTKDNKHTWYLASSGNWAVIVLKDVIPGDGIDEASRWVGARVTEEL